MITKKSQQKYYPKWNVMARQKEKHKQVNFYSEKELSYLDREVHTD